MPLRGQRVVVIGGSAGIGRAVAELAAGVGAEVVLVGRDLAAARAAAETIGPAATARQLDVRQEATLPGFFRSVGPFHHLAITAHESSTRLGVNRPIADVAIDAAQAFFAGKFWSQYAAAKHALPHLPIDGSIVLTSGVASRKILPGHTVIAAVNAAVDACARQLAREVAPRRVNVVSPGLTTTRTYDHMPETERQSFFANIAGRLPVGRIGEPADVAAAYILAMTNRYMTGVVVDVDGGLLIS